MSRMHSVIPYNTTRGRIPEGVQRPELEALTRLCARAYLYHVPIIPYCLVCVCTIKPPMLFSANFVPVHELYFTILFRYEKLSPCFV